MPAHEVVVAGATGFIGSHVLNQLVNNGMKAHGFSRGADPSRNIGTGNLTAPETYAWALENCRTVVHAAPYVGNDAAQSRRTNINGTRQLLRACFKAGVERVIYVSTASIYGFGPHRRLVVNGTTPAPTSSRSQHRFQAEQAVLAAGGCVLRPNLVYRRGDKWVIPGIAALIETIGALPNNGEALLSITSASELGSAIAHLCEIDPKTISGKVFHATRPEPVTTWQIANTMMMSMGRYGLRKTPHEDIWPAAQSLGFSEHQYDLINTDHWYDPEGFWDLVGVTPGAGFNPTADENTWYRNTLALSHD